MRVETDIISIALQHMMSLFGSESLSLNVYQRPILNKPHIKAEWLMDKLTLVESIVNNYDSESERKMPESIYVIADKMKVKA